MTDGVKTAPLMATVATVMGTMLPILTILRSLSSWLRGHSRTALMHSRNFPALRSILIADNTHSSQEPVMCVVIPYYLARVQELMIASERPVELVFGCAHMTWRAP